MIQVGNKLIERCVDCGKLVRVNKWLFGSMHICITDLERQNPYRVTYRPLTADDLEQAPVKRKDAA